MVGETQYGGFWIRFFALMVDAAILIVAGIALGITGSLLGAVGATIGATLFLLLQIAYMPVMHASARQATFGKALLGLKVVHAGTGERISILRAIGRDIIGKLVSSLVLMLGFLMAAFTGRKQALHDLLSSTMVVREGPAHVAAAVVVAVVGFVGPMIAIPLFGIALVTGMMASMMSAMVGDIKKEANKAAAKPAIVARAPARPAPPRPAPTPMAEAPRAAPPSPATVLAAVAPAPATVPSSAPAATPSPVPVNAAPPSPAPVKIAVAPPAAPAEAAPRAQPIRQRPRAPQPAATPVSTAATPAAAPPEEKVVRGPKYGDLLSAVLARDAAGVQELLDFGKWVDKPDRGGTTPLMVAVSLGDVASAEALLKAGADAGKAVSTARGDKAMLGLLQRYGATLPRP